MGCVAAVRVATSTSIWKLDFVLQYNTGGAFSLAQGWAPVIGGRPWSSLRSWSYLSVTAINAVAVALGLVMGGALGNLSDRVFRSHHGAVVDFIALHFWPTFNVADSCVVVGGALLAVLMWRSQATPRVLDSRGSSAACRCRACGARR